MPVDQVFQPRVSAEEFSKRARRSCRRRQKIAIDLGNAAIRRYACVRKQSSESENSSIWVRLQSTLEQTESHPARYAGFRGNLIIGRPINEELNRTSPALDGIPQIGIFDDLLIDGWPCLEIEDGSIDGIQ